jgi:hypothetical protein
MTTRDDPGRSRGTNAANGAGRSGGVNGANGARGSVGSGGSVGSVGSGRSGGSVGSGGRSLSPGLVFLAVALIGSAGFALYAVTVRDASQIPLLAAGSAVLGIVFIALAAYSVRSTWRAGIDGRSGKAIGLGIGGGIAAIIGAGCLAAAIILFLLSQGPTG